MTNQPIEEKWKAEFDKKFLFKSTSYGDPAVEYVNQANIIQDTTELKSFIENLLEQERKRMSDEVKELPWLHNDSGVKELKENVDYVEVKEVLSIINK